MQVSLHVDILLSGESGDVLEKVAILIPSNDSDVSSTKAEKEADTKTKAETDKTSRL